MSMKILVVDPDWHFLQQAREYLEGLGNHVVHEPRPDDAAARARHWRPDVVMVSAELPEACEGDLLATLTALTPRPAVVLTAALENFGHAWRAWQRGGDELIIKPVLNASEFHVAIVAAFRNAAVPARDRTIPQPAARSA